MARKVVVCVVAMSQLLLLMLTVMNNFHFRSSTCASGHPTDPPHHQTFQAAASTTPFTSTKEASRSNRDSNTISNRPEIPIVLGIDGGTESIRAAFFNAYTGHRVGQSYSCAYETYRPNPGWAEQHPDEWYASLCVAVRGALASIEGEIVPENEGAAAGTGGLDGDSYHDVVDDNIVGGGREDNNMQKYILKSLCIDTTCCSVVALSSTHTPLRPSLLWMDARSAKEAKLIMEVVAREVADITSKSKSGNEEKKEDHYGSDVSPYTSSSTKILLSHFPELRINSAGHGPISAEFLLPKSMWIKQNEPQLWDKAAVICEYQDYINYRLTGRMVASGCNAAVRWHHDGWEVVQKSKGGTDGSGRDAADGGGDESKRTDEHRGRPMRLYKALNMEELASKLPRTTIAMGDIVGGLTSDAARDLGLPVGTMVVQGGPDAFVGMIGLGTVKPGQTCLITGSSHLHCMVTSNPGSSSPGTWGAYRGAPLPHLNFIEGGQSSTGCLIRWVRDLTCPGGGSYKTLDEEASAIPPGCDGLVALETWQGSRTPHTDPLARGALLGLTLSHTRAHIYRSLLEAVCYGTRSCLDALEEAATSSSSTESNEVVIAGGATRSDLWLQLHADITGRTFVLNENADGPLLGCAILASVGAGIYSSVEEAVQNMVRRERRIAPRTDTKKVYNRLYEEVYMKVRPSVTNVFHALANLRGGGDSGSMRHGSMSDIEWSKVGRNRVNAEDKSLHGCLDNCIEQCSIRGGGSAKRTPIISPSLLASDWSDIKGEVQKCLDAGVPWLHIDVFDGVFLDSPRALTFGPYMIDCIRRRFRDRPDLVLDVHLCVERPERYVRPMADAGTSRLIFQWEAMEDNSAIRLARDITSLGMKCGISINPETNVSNIYSLLDTGMVDVVDVLAVEPGFGGQEFNHVVIHKIELLRRYRDENLLPRGIDLKILVDGGINRDTSTCVIDAGADILVAGTALFRNPRGFEEAIKELY